MRHLKVMMAVVAMLTMAVAGATAQSATQKQVAKPSTQKPNLPPPAPVPAEYVIGADDVVAIVVMDENSKLSGNFTVRPDGKIAMLQIGDLQASGLKPELLRQN